MRIVLKDRTIREPEALGALRRSPSDFAAGSVRRSLVMLILFREKLIDRVEGLQPVLLQQDHVRAFADLDPSPILRGFVWTEIGVREACPSSRSTPGHWACLSAGHMLRCARWTRGAIPTVQGRF